MRKKRWHSVLCQRFLRLWVHSVQLGNIENLRFLNNSKLAIGELYAALKYFFRVNRVHCVRMLVGWGRPMPRSCILALFSPAVGSFRQPAVC